MSSRLQSAPPAAQLAPWLLVGGIWAALGVFWVTWLSGRISAVLSGHAWDTGPGFGVQFMRQLVRGDFEQLWPDVPGPLIVVVEIIVLTGIAVPVVWMWRRLAQWWPRSNDPLRSLATPADVRSLTLTELAKKTRRLRPSLAGQRTISADDAGLLLGNLKPSKAEVRASWEDVIVAVMAPRAGKTTSLAVPAIIGAPGAVVATSNKADLWAATATVRERRGHVWVFDPQQIAHFEQRWWWNPLAGVTNVEQAARLAGHFIQEVRGKGDGAGKDFWSTAAHDLLTSLILAAVCDGRSLLDVYEWLNEVGSFAPSDILRRNGHAAMAASFAGRQAGAPETRDGIYETARTAAQCLRDPEVTRWVTPGHAPMVFDPASFVTSHDTLYLMSKDGAGAAAPLVAALADRVLQDGVRYAESRGGRLDPPMVLVLDEAANVCRISDLPDLYSHLGSRGINPITILQSYQQGVRVWNKTGMDSLWSAATIKLIGSGIDDPQLSEELARLVGDHDVTLTSYSQNHDGRISASTSLRKERILPANDIRALPKGSALLMATGIKPALLQLAPWFSGRHAAEIGKAQESLLAALTARADLKWRNQPPLERTDQ